MAEEKEEREEKEEKEEPKEEPKQEPKTVEKIIERDREPSLVDCPECDLSVREDKLGSHRWKAHQVERRASREETDDTDDAIAPPKTKHATTREKREEPKSEPSGLFGAWRR